MIIYPIIANNVIIVKLILFINNGDLNIGFISFF